MLFISEALAQTADAAPPQPNIFESMFPLILIFVIFYFLLIRPQHKKLKAHDAMVSSLKRGDEVVTSGGIIGKISKVEDKILHVEIASDVVVRVNRSSVSEVVSSDKKSESKAAGEEKKSKQKKK